MSTPFADWTTETAITRGDQGSSVAGGPSTRMEREEPLIELGSHNLLQARECERGAVEEKSTVFESYVGHILSFLLRGFR